MAPVQKYCSLTGAYPVYKTVGFYPYEFVPMPKDYCFCQDPQITKNIPIEKQTCPQGQACGVCAPEYTCNVCNADFYQLCNPYT